MALNVRFRNWLQSLGSREDPTATDTTSPWSAMSLLKAIYAQLAGGGLQLALVESLSGTSSSSVAIDTGTKTFTTQSGKSWQIGQWLNIASTADPAANFMNGPVTAYDRDTGVLEVAVDNKGGSGTYADWVISLSGVQGGRGAKGDKGDQGDPGEVGVSGVPTTGRLARFAGPTSIEDADAAISTDGTLASNSDAEVPSVKAVKTYADGLITALKNGVDTAFDTLQEIATALGGKLTASNNLSDIGNVSSARSNLGLVIGTNVQAYDAATAKLDVEDQALTGGARVTSKSLGTITTGTVTPDPGDRPMQHYTNNGAHTLAPGTNKGAYYLDILNGASAGAITKSGWTKETGAAFTTTNAHKFRCYCSIGEQGSSIHVEAFQ
jgi:hypothetical protein